MFPKENQSDALQESEKAGVTFQMFKNKANPKPLLLHTGAHTILFLLCLLSEEQQRRVESILKFIFFQGPGGQKVLACSLGAYPDF